MKSWPQSDRQANRQEASDEGGSCPMDLGSLLPRGGDVNVGDVERVLSVMGGGVLALFGATRGGLTGLGLAVLGGGLLYRGVTGHCEAYRSMGIDTTDEPQAGRGAGSKRGAHA